MVLRAATPWRLVGVTENSEEHFVLEDRSSIFF
jgi:hypothetical protein